MYKILFPERQLLSPKVAYLLGFTVLPIDFRRACDVYLSFPGLLRRSFVNFALSLFLNLGFLCTD